MQIKLLDCTVGWKMQGCRLLNCVLRLHWRMRHSFVFLVAVAYTNSDCNKHIQVYQRKVHEMG